MTCWRHCVDAVASVQLRIKPASGSLRAKPSTCDPAEHAVVGEPNTQKENKDGHFRGVADRFKVNNSMQKASPQALQFMFDKRNSTSSSQCWWHIPLVAGGMASKSHICRLWSCCRLKQPVWLTPKFSMLVSQAKSDKQPKPFRKMTKWRRRECVHLQTHLIWYRYIYIYMWLYN